MLVILMAALSLLEVPLRSAVLTLIVLATILQFGGLMVERGLSRAMGLGVGFVVGAGVIVAIGQVLLLLNMPPYVAHWTALGGLLGLVGVSKGGRSVRGVTEHFQFSREVLFALSVSLLILSMRQPWMFAFAIPLAVFERATTDERVPQAIRLISLVLLPVGWLAAAEIRPDRWWYFYQYNDTAFFESLGWSIAHWGLLDYSGFVGDSISGYHWFAYAFFGALSHLSGLEPWDALTKIAAPFLTFCLVSVFAGIRKPTHSWSHYFAVVVSVASLNLFVLDSFGFSILVATALISVCLVADSVTATRKLIFLVATASVVLFLSKTSTAVVVALYLASRVVFGGTGRRRQPLIALGTMSAVCIATYLLLFTQKPPSAWLYWEIDSLGEIADNVAGLLGNPTLVSQYILWLYALRLAFSRKQLVLGRLLPILTVLLATLSVSLTQVADEWEYFGFATIPLVTYLAVSYFAHSYQDTLHLAIPRNRLMLLVLGFMVASAVGFMFGPTIQRFNNDIDISKFFGDHLWLVFISSGPLYLILGVILVGAATHRPQFSGRSAIPLLLVVAVLAGMSLQDYRTVASLGTERYTEEVNGSGYPSLRAFAPPDLVELGQYIRKNTPSDSVLASNYFCCPGSDWWKTQLSNGAKTRYTSVFEIFEQWGGADFRLVAETRRRYLVQGNFHITNFPSIEQIDRMNLVLDFANSPTSEIVDRLKDRGALGYIVYLPNTVQRDWSEFAVEKFRNQSFLYLELL